MKKYNKISAAFLSLVMVVAFALSGLNVEAATTYTKDDTDTMIAALAENNPILTDGFAYGSEDLIIDYVRGGGVVTDEQKSAYVLSLLDTVTDGLVYGYAGYNAKPVLTLQMLGIDPTDVEGVNLLAALLDETNISSMSVYYAPYWIAALENSGVDYNEELVISTILKQRDASGAFGYSWDGVFYVDVDACTMAIQGLSYYYTSSGEVKTAVDATLAYVQTNLLGMNAYGYESPESLSQFIIALVSLGIDPSSETYYYNEQSLVERLFAYYSDGGFTYEIAHDPTICYEQCTMATVAYNRYLYGKTYIFDTSDIATTFSYTVLEGESQTVNIAASDASFSVRIDGPLERFVSVEMDGVTVDSTNYTVTSGTTVLTFTSDYAKTLSVGTHTLVANFTDGIATMTVTVESKQESIETPTTTPTTTTDTTETITSPQTGYSWWEIIVDWIFSLINAE